MVLVYQIITVWPRHSRLRERFKSRDDESTTFQHRRHTTSGICHSLSILLLRLLHMVIGYSWEGVISE